MRLKLQNQPLQVLKPLPQMIGGRRLNGLSILPESLEEEDRGREVSFMPPWAPREDGSIMWWNDTYIFVRYRLARRVYATSPEHLVFRSAASEHRNRLG